MDMVIAVEKDSAWVIKNYGSAAEERKTPGSRATSQAKRIAEFVRQWQDVTSFMAQNHIDLIEIRPGI